MNLTLKSIISKNLSKKQIGQICNLKNKQWKYGIKSQIIWFKKNVKHNDIHNLFFIGSQLIGYTLLRKRKYNFGDNKSYTYLLFDTLVLEKKYREKKLSTLMMIFNNIVIKNSGYFAFLVCKKSLIKFYEKYNWFKLKKQNFLLEDHPFKTNGMIFGKKMLKSKKYYFFTNK